MISGFVLLSTEFNQGHLYPSGLELSTGWWAHLPVYNWRQCLPLPRMSVAHSFAVMADAPKSLPYPWLTVGRASLGQNLCGQPQMVWLVHATVDYMAFHNPSPYCYSAPAFFLSIRGAALNVLFRVEPTCRLSSIFMAVTSLYLHHHSLQREASLVRTESSLCIWT